MNLNPTAVVMWAILGCIGWLVGRDVTTVVVFVLAGLSISFFAGLSSR